MSEPKTTTAPVHLVCPHCEALNRVPAARLEESPRCGSCHESLIEDHPLTLDEKNFQRHVDRNDLPVVVDFWAPWCGPCLNMAPEFERASQALKTHARLAKLNTEEAQAIAARYAIRSIPTMIAFRGGREIARHSGAIGAAQIVRWVQQLG